MNNKLYDWANSQMKLNITHQEVEIMIKDFTPLKHDTMHHAYIRTAIKRLGQLYYGKEFDVEISKLFFSEIKQKFNTLSCSDVNHCFEKIIDNKTQVSKFFNISEINKILSQFKNAKQKVREKHFQLISDEKQDSESIEKYAIFLNLTRLKYKNKETLNVYEKSALGRDYERNIPNANEILDFTVNSLEKKNKELYTIQEARLQTRKEGIFNAFLPLEEATDEPIFWTQKLLYGYNLFNSISQ